MFGIKKKSGWFKKSRLKFAKKRVSHFEIDFIGGYYLRDHDTIYQREGLLYKKQEDNYRMKANSLNFSEAFILGYDLCKEDEYFTFSYDKNSIK